jgi:TolB protein
MAVIDSFRSALRGAVLSTAFCAGLAQAALEVTVRGGRQAPVPVAVVPFANNGDLTQVATVVAKDLQSSGLFTPLDPADMLAQPSQPKDVNFINWRTINAQHLVIGTLEPRDASSSVIRFWLLNVTQERESLAYTIPTRNSDLRYAAHRIADLIYQELTGIRGVFNTDITYVVARGRGDQREFQLVMADADGANERLLTRSDEPLLSPTFSKQRDKVAYVAFQQGLPGIFVQTLATGAITPLLAKEGINGAPAFAPDGQRLAVTLSFEGNPEIYWVDLQTRRLTRLTRSSAIDTEPVWSPDGRSIYFTSDRAGKAQIYRMDSTGGGVERLTFEGISNARADVSPDGRKLTYVQQTASGYRVVVHDLQTNNTRLLTPGPLDESPRFAPNGDVIIYSTKGRGNQAELATVTISSGVRRELRQVGDVREPAWSPFTD